MGNETVLPLTIIVIGHKVHLIPSVFGTFSLIHANVNFHRITFHPDFCLSHKRAFFESCSSFIEWDYCDKFRLLGSIYLLRISFCLFCFDVKFCLCDVSLDAFISLNIVFLRLRFIGHIRLLSFKSPTDCGLAFCQLTYF